MRRIFWGFCRNWFLIDPLHYISSSSAFGFEFAEIFVIEKRLRNSASRQLSDSAMPSLRDVAHDGVLCTSINRSASDQGKWCGPSGQAAWTVHHVQNHTLLGHSPPTSLAGQPSSLRTHWATFL
jgi:hypothetical protein